MHLSPWLATSLHPLTHPCQTLSSQQHVFICVVAVSYVVCRDGLESDDDDEEEEEEEDDSSSRSSSSRSGDTRVRKAAERMSRNSPQAVQRTRAILMRDAAKAIQR